MAELVSSVNRANWMWILRTGLHAEFNVALQVGLQYFSDLGLIIYFSLFLSPKAAFWVVAFTHGFKAYYFVGTWGCKDIYSSHFTRGGISGWNDTRFKTLVFTILCLQRESVFVTCILMSVLYKKNMHS